MPQQLFYHVFHTSAGWMGVLASSDGLLELILPQNKESEVRRLLRGRLEKADHTPERFNDLVRRLDAYFSGQKTDFPDKLDLAGATPFQKEVWQATADIPYGQTRSYAQTAEKIGKPRAFRAVGNALGKNPLPIIIPCHRVVAIDGGLGGYSGGLEMKRMLLGLEGAGDNLKVKSQKSKP